MRGQKIGYKFIVFARGFSKKYLRSPEYSAPQHGTYRKIAEGRIRVLFARGTGLMDGRSKFEENVGIYGGKLWGGCYPLLVMYNFWGRPFLRNFKNFQSNPLCCFSPAGGGVNVCLRLSVSAWY